MNVPSNPTNNQSPDELDALFNQTINAKRVAIETVDAVALFGDNKKIAEEANKLLDQFRAEFKSKVESWIREARQEHHDWLMDKLGDADSLSLHDFELIRNEAEARLSRLETLSPREETS